MSPSSPPYGLSQRPKSNSRKRKSPPPDATLVERRRSKRISSAAKAKAQAKEQEQNLAECIACYDQTPPSNSITCPCSHTFCKECLVQLVKSLKGDESLYPLRCCKENHIPISENSWLFDAEFIREYEMKMMEYGTKDRTYCHVPTCSAFIPPREDKVHVLSCNRCSSKTCRLCKEKSHRGRCRRDAQNEEVMEMMKENNWQQCRECRRVVERESGCLHMSKPPLLEAG